MDGLSAFGSPSHVSCRQSLFIACRFVLQGQPFLAISLWCGLCGVTTGRGVRSQCCSWTSKARPRMELRKTKQYMLWNREREREARHCRPTLSTIRQGTSFKQRAGQAPVPCPWYARPGPRGMRTQFTRSVRAHSPHLQLAAATGRGDVTAGIEALAATAGLFPGAPCPRVARACASCYAGLLAVWLVGVGTGQTGFAAN